MRLWRICIIFGRLSRVGASFLSLALIFLQKIRVCSCRCSSSIAKGHARDACSVVNALETALACCQPFASVPEARDIIFGRLSRVGANTASLHLLFRKSFARRICALASAFATVRWRCQLFSVLPAPQKVFCVLFSHNGAKSLIQ